MFVVAVVQMLALFQDKVKELTAQLTAATASKETAAEVCSRSNHKRNYVFVRGCLLVHTCTARFVPY